MFTILSPILTGAIVYLIYRFSRSRRGMNTPSMRRFYGHTEAETLANQWADGLYWLPKFRAQEERVAHSPRPGIGFGRVLYYHTFALSLTTDGVFTLRDNREENSVGTLRFRRTDILRLTQLPKGADAAGVAANRNEGVNVVLQLRNGHRYWLQLPESAYQALTEIDPTRPV